MQRVCELVDCVSLSIEVAAANLTAFRVNEVAEMLEREELPAGGPSPSGSMADAVRLAVDALDGDVRSTLEAATVFRGVFDRHGFCSVGAPEHSAGDANAALAELVDRSLVHADRSSGEV